ncbi:hypothetical protein HOR97_gp53 [Agrobacterium phage Atu_ph03]|uniref:Uncharacterized protein n=1 Tax=Agrobacterium phage Atu_ph03 TaxID=2024262 RepID=A0A2L0UZ52_9CAUD|nr:hypothetical protein HOR97_gp53 [Agrobacterium phage Atu_ph03]AUZ94801.1 hypothetical protein [Agrobacterium phage Atu_ph03]
MIERHYRVHYTKDRASVLVYVYILYGPHDKHRVWEQPTLGMDGVDHEIL